MRKNSYWLAGCFLTASLAEVPAEAQTATAPPAAPTADLTALDEIQVTAERRETSVQRVSAAIQVVTGDTMQNIGIVDTENLQVHVPGLVNSHLGGPTERIYLRGIGNDLYGIASSNSVATYIDGVYVPNSSQSFQAFNDVDQVEVLKGPQAVLYGRNATGGAILINSKRPEFDPAANAEVSWGNFNDREARAALTGPIVGDRLAGRLAVQYIDREAFGYNENNGRGQDPLRDMTARGTLLGKVTEALTATLTFDYSRLVTGDYVKTPNTNAWNYQTTVGQFLPDPFQRFSNHDSYAPLQDTGARLGLDWNTSLGHVTSITSFRDFKFGPFTYDNDDVGTPMAIPTSPPIVLGELWVDGGAQSSRQFSHETYIATPSENRLRFVAGANIFLEHADEQNRGVFFAPSFSNRHLDNPAYGVYLDGQFDVLTNLTLSAGGRYSYEKKTYSLTPLTADANLNITGAGAEVTGQAHWDQFTPRFGIEYRPFDGKMIYFTATKGFKSGGFNTDDPTNEFSPEDIWSYEGGIKATWLGSLTTNLSGFYYDYSNLQVQQVLLPSGKSVVTNAASATLYGLDGELQWRFNRQFAIGSNFLLMHSEYGNLTLFNDLLATPANVSVEGNTLKRAPKLTFLPYADYSTDIGPGALAMHVEGAFRSTTYYTPFEDAPHAQPGFWLLNANAKYSFNKDRMYVSFYGQNLTNRLYATSIEDVARNLGPISGAPLYTHYGPPRLYGVRFGVSFR
jgi:iron complex outermembrane recepter protein